MIDFLARLRAVPHYLLLLLSALGSSALLAEEQSCPSPTEYEYHGEPQPIEMTAQDSQTVVAMVEVLSRHHYQKLELDDALSMQLLDEYLDRLDPSKSYLLQADVDDFRGRYGDLLDDFLRRGELAAASEIYLLYRERAIERLESVIAQLEDPQSSWSFDADDSLPVDRDDYIWPADTDAADQLWDKMVRLGLLNLILSGEELAEAKQILARRYKSQLSFLKQQKSIAVVDQYLNALGRLYDPHTDYFSPRNSENFEINMSLSLEGIGAVLQNENELTRVVSLVPGGPADLGGELKPGDRITRIGEGLACDYIDVVGWRIDEVVDLIRGPKGTTVRLEVIPSEVDELSEARRVIQIVRDQVKLEDNAAKGELHEVELDGAVRKLGVINIPSFYLDVSGLQNGDVNYRSTTRDVHALIEELRGQGMEGLILDLRANGGGSLLESAMLTDLFIEPGPVVQIRDQNNRIDRQQRARQGAYYDGPLLVLIDRLSASASEIFAGAIQDYGRGLVVGSGTFGKGTVQTVLDLPKGQIKITESKFYRISGESTQHRGVLPDIELPSLYDPEEIGESAYKNALDWDRITGIPHRNYFRFPEILPELVARHDLRMQQDPDLLFLQQRIAIDNERRALETISLSEQKRIEERDYWEQRQLDAENAWRASRGLPPKSDDDPLLTDGFAVDDPLDEDAIDEEADTDGDELPDAILDESARILADLIHLEETSSRSLVSK